ncbi:MAG: capsule assembly Wzi family protein, partial [Sphaerochaetaceae bacterium]|nr:capsule assembly Wzi family protein [Sphaerochaetaceae bacterium]
VLVLLTIFMAFSLWALTPVKSLEEDYYEFLVLTGKAERSYLTYRTIYTSTYSNENGFWKDSLLYNTKNNLTIYGPDVFTSYNTVYPSGQNDGSLWQGKGFNAQLRLGASYKTGNFTFTLRPELDWSQNLEYETIGGTYEYFWDKFGFDLPQRFGDSSFFTFNPGDSEVRFATEHFTVGAGFSALWTGPMYLNSVLHSNNAGSYPRADLGIMNVEVPIPFTDSKLGTIEAFYSLGILQNSEYAICNKGENSLLHVATFAFRPDFFKNLTLGVHIVDHDEFSTKGLVGFFKTLFSFKNGNEDFKWSFSLDLLFDEIGFEAYGEIGQDDYGLRVNNSYHTVVFQLGMRKSFDLIKDNRLSGQVIFEYGNMEMSRDAFTQWSYNFYTHGKGSSNSSYSHLGQILGAGTAYAGNSQYLAVQLYYPAGMTTLYAQRHNPDNNYIYDLVNHKAVDPLTYFRAFKGILAFGFKSTVLVFNNMSVTAGATYENIVNAYYETGDVLIYRDNFHFEIGLSYRF